MAEELIEWFSSQSLWRQLFIGLWVAFIAFPIVALTVLQFLESMRSTRESTRNYGKPRDGDKEKQ